MSKRTSINYASSVDMLLSTIDNLPQPCVLQSVDSVEEPKHSYPPLIGKGLVQVLCLVILPPPHVALQDPYFSKLLQPPLTAAKNVIGHLKIKNEQ